MRKSIALKEENINFKYRVAGILKKDNKILFVEMDNSNFLCLPGGYVELGETSEEACLRELEEEVTKKFKIGNYCGVIENYFVNKYHRNVHELSMYYKVSLVDAMDTNDFSLVENDKGHLIKLNFKWLDINELDNYNIRPVILKNILKDNMNFNHLIINDLPNNID